MPHTSSTGVFLPISLQYGLQYSILVFLTVLLTSAFLYSIKSRKLCVFLTLLNAFLFFLIAFYILHSTMELSYSAFLFSPLVYIYFLQVYFTLSSRSYLSDFLIVNWCGSNQAWVWLEKLNSGVINHSYVLTGGQGVRGKGGGKHFFTQGHVGLDFFPFIKKTLHLKTACCVYLCYL